MQQKHCKALKIRIEFGQNPASVESEQSEKPVLLTVQLYTTLVHRCCDCEVIYIAS